MTHIVNIIQAAAIACLNAVEPFENENRLAGDHRHGGFFCMLEEDDSNLPPLAKVMIGGPRKETWSKYAGLSEEKARRLASKPGDKSSWQSRNLDLDYYGGAIRCKDGTILSFSGLSEHGDEALVLMVAEFCNLLSRTEAIAIAKKSGNTLYMKIVSKEE